MACVENFGLESFHLRRPSIRVVISRSNIYGAAHADMQVPSVVGSANPGIALSSAGNTWGMWSTDSLIGIAGMSDIDTDDDDGDDGDDGDEAPLLGNHVKVEAHGKKDKKGLWTKLKQKFKRTKSPATRPWSRIVSDGLGGILVSKETKVGAEDKPSGLPKSQTAADFRPRPRRPISTNWRADYDELLYMGDERDKKGDSATLRVGGLMRSLSAILPGRD
ncbi:hypothetical protein F5B19DRAFT_334496 [Rostrohypoxylon terebratum]|nr:hypothetical protein F5B19DRAFT_334496 [Rostrohypoxylon terebratum]